jgi:hypothetical protein
MSATAEGRSEEGTFAAERKDRLRELLGSQMRNGTCIPESGIALKRRSKEILDNVQMFFSAIGRQEVLTNTERHPWGLPLATAVPWPFSRGRGKLAVSPLEPNSVPLNVGGTSSEC